MSENKPVGHEGRPPLVVTLWETYGSNMEAIAERLAEDLDCRCTSRPTPAKR